MHLRCLKLEESEDEKKKHEALKNESHGLCKLTPDGLDTCQARRQWRLSPKSAFSAESRRRMRSYGSAVN